MRTDPASVLRTSSTEIVGTFLCHVSALRTVCNDLENFRDALEGLPRHSQPLPQNKVLWDYLPTIDWFWVKNGRRPLIGPFQDGRTDSYRNHLARSENARCGIRARSGRFCESVFRRGRSEGNALPVSAARLHFDRVWHHAKFCQ